MVKENGYEPIPDVEKGEGGVPLSPKEKYPEANELQLELLTKLDACIEGPKLEFEVPKITAEDLGMSSAEDIKAYLESVVVPTVITAVLVGIFLLLEHWDFTRDLMEAAYPYIAGTIIFVPSALAMQDRIMSSAKKAFDTFEQGGDNVELRVDTEAKRIDGTIESVQTKTHEVLAGMKPTLDMATKAETVLKQVDPEIDIPDPTDIDRELDGIQSMIGQAFNKVKEALDWRKLLPGFSEDNLKIYVVIPVLLVFYFIQMFGVYEAAANSDPESVAPLVAPYITTVVENATVIFGSTAAVIYAVNSQKDKIVAEVKRVIMEQGATQIVEEIFGERLERVKEKLLKLIKKVNMIELFMQRPEVQAAIKMANTDLKKTAEDLTKKASDLQNSAKNATDDAKNVIEKMSSFFS